MPASASAGSEPAATDSAADATMPRPFPRSFVPATFDASDFSQIEPLFDALLARPVGSAAELGHWLRDASELSSAIDEYGSRRYIDKSCHTDDEAIKKRYMQFIEEVEPKIKPLGFRLQKKYLESPHRAELTSAGDAQDARRFFVLDRKWQADVELFREENVPLETEAAKLNAEYDAVCGAMMVSFRGREYTPQQMARFLEEPDRPTRQEAWEAGAKRRLQDAEKAEDIFDRLLELRSRIAANAGLGDYRALTWKAYKRFEYTPGQCLQFADAIEQVCVPIVEELDRQRRDDLGLDRLRPWDADVDPRNRPALKPFEQSQTPAFVEKVKAMFARMSPALADDFDVLRKHGNLDLESRKGKQPGGYQCSLEESREPFIFMNAAGLQRDVETLLHEGGHAFHCLAAREEPLAFLRSAPMEFCEVASMAMEMLGAEHYDVFYDEADAARAKRAVMEGPIRFLPWMAVIDSFQHWLYTHPGHSRQQRTDHWLSLADRFGTRPGKLIDWAGYEPVLASFWQRQLHLFHAPFYYIEYGIAQLGALQLWMKSKEDPRKALANYRAALALGGTRTLPELFSAAGIRFDFSVKTLAPLMTALRDELASLPR